MSQAGVDPEGVDHGGVGVRDEPKQYNFMFMMIPARPRAGISGTSEMSVVCGHSLGFSHWHKQGWFRSSSNSTCRRLCGPSLSVIG